MDDLETLWLGASGAERALYLGPAWRAADHRQRAEVLREEPVAALELAWQVCNAAQRRAFVAIWAREVSVALDAALVSSPSQYRRPESKQSLARRLNSLEKKFPDLAGMCALWRKQLGITPGIKRGMSPQMVERTHPDGRKILRDWPGESLR